jgi:hypothetical protein
MGGVVHDAPLHPHHLGDAVSGPDLAAEPLGFGAAAQQGGQLGELLGSQPAGFARRWAMASRLGANPSA